MISARLSVLAFGVALTGCANLNTVDRSTALPSGVAIHLDAPQRVVISNLSKVCAEPSPDALQAYASSLGLGFGGPGKEAASIAQALSANAGSIGLRTQSITLMRDALYRICEMYMNGQITPGAAIQMLQRSQDLTLGVLAIEQLTGAVVAQQVVLTNTSAASAAATINSAQREIDQARADESAKKKAVENADKAVETQTKAAADKKTAADAAKQKAVAVQKFIDDLAPRLSKAKQDHADAQSARLGAAMQAQALDVLMAKPAADKKKLEEALKPLHVATESAKQTHSEAVAAKKSDDEIKKLKQAWDEAAAAEKPAADALKANQDKIDTLQSQIDEVKKLLAKANADEERTAAVLSPLQAQMDVAKKDPDQIASEKAAAELKTATDDLDKKKLAATETKKAYEEAQANTLAVEKLGSSAVTNAAANTTSGGQFSTAVSRPAMSKDTVEVLTRGTVKIVETVMNKGHVTDTCGVLLMTKGAEMGETLLALCSQVVLGALNVWREDALVKIARCKADPTCADPSIGSFAILPTSDIDFPSSTITPLKEILKKSKLGS